MRYKDVIMFSSTKSTARRLVKASVVYFSWVACLVSLVEAWAFKRQPPDAISRTPRIAGTIPDTVGNIVCPKTPIYPPEFLLIVLCCSANGLPPQAIRTDRKDVHYDDWDTNLPYCHVTLDKKQNIGLESSAYLHYFATRYANLSKWTIMVHGNHGWHDQVHKRWLLSPNSSKWLPLKLPYVPLPSPLVHDPDIDLRYDRKVSIQEFYDQQFVQRFGYPPALINTPGTDRVHYCCAQFVVSREAVQRNNASVYAAIRDYVYDENNDYRTSRELEHSWPILLTGHMRASDATMAAVEQWRDDAMMSPCHPWGCTCQGLSDLHQVWISHPGTAPPHAYAWFLSGDYEHVGTIQVTTLGQTLGKGLLHSPVNRSMRTGRCLTVPAGMDPSLAKDAPPGLSMGARGRLAFPKTKLFAKGKNRLI
eukprot:m.375347 g.375347  ORF g.375347 m.375347 type:complete len:420 (-) comp20917_c0_seq3:142-1401(-)